MPDKEENEEKKEEGKEEGAGEKDSGEVQKKPFDNLDLNVWRCFGIQHPKSKSWVSLCVRSQVEGWRSIDVSQLQASLKANVDESYLRIATFFLTDLDDDMKYTCFFDSQKAMWSLQVQDSPKAEISLEQKADFFMSDMFKKVAGRTADLVARAVVQYNEVIEQHLKSGELLEVDEVKLAAILHIANQKFAMDNLRSGKWMK